MDIMYINNIPIFTSIDKRYIEIQSTGAIKDQTSEELFKGLDTVLHCYNYAGFQVKQAYCDREVKR